MENERRKRVGNTLQKRYKSFTLCPHGFDHCAVISLVRAKSASRVGDPVRGGILLARYSG